MKMVPARYYLYRVRILTMMLVLSAVMYVVAKALLTIHA